MGLLSQRHYKATITSGGVRINNGEFTVESQEFFLNQAEIPVGAELKSDVRGPLTGRSLAAPVHVLRRLSPWILLGLVWLVCALYLASDLRRGWLPHDDGVLAQSAERVSFGELPHRDFDEIYTGALSYLNAAGFRLFGTNLASMRYVLYLFFLAWVPSLYYIALRFTTPLIAAGFTFLAVAWSVPNYPTAMPSWYNLFFATFGAAAIFRYIEGGRRKWLLVAGLCGGLSFLFKLSGMYFVAGAVLFLLSKKEEGGAEATKSERWCCISLAAACVVVYELSVFSLLRKVFYPGSFLYFFLPIVIIGVAVIWQSIRGTTQKRQLLATVENLLWFGAGVATPIALFLIPYMRTGAVGDFVRGVFVLPGKRLHFTVRTQSLPRFVTGTAADLIVVALISARAKRFRSVAGWVLATTSIIAVFVSGNHPKVYDAVWVPIWNMLPVAVGVGVFLLLFKSDQTPPEGKQKIFLLLSVTACCSLIQFPYSAPIYFCYVAPLLILSVAGISTIWKSPSRIALSITLGVCVLFAVVVVTPRFLSNRGELYVPSSGKADFVLPRAGGLHLYGTSAKTLAELVTITTQHAHGSYIYATPDCPEVYFLSGFRNPTRTLFDFLDEQRGRTERINGAIHAHDVNLIVINLAPGFSGVPADLRTMLEKEFPNHTLVGNYEVRWKS